MELQYQTGFGNDCATEALPGALPRRPQLAAAVPLRPVRRTAVRHRLHRAARQNRRSWLYRIRPARSTSRLSAMTAPPAG